MAARRNSHRKTPHERWMGLCIHFAVFIVVNTGLTTLNLMQRPEKLWFYWPLAGWGFGLILHASIYYKNRKKK